MTSPRAARSGASSGPRPAWFGFSFAAASLAGVWLAASGGPTGVVALAAHAFAAVALVSLVATSICIGWPGDFRRRIRTAVAADRSYEVMPFLVVMALGPGLLPPRLAEVSVAAALAPTAYVAAGVVGNTVRSRLAPTAAHPGALLPSAVALLFAAKAGQLMGWTHTALALFVLGTASWILVGVPVALARWRRAGYYAAPTHAAASEIAPACLTITVMLSLNGGHVDAVVTALAIVAGLLAVAQLRSVSHYRTLPLQAESWALVYSSCAAAGGVLGLVTASVGPAAGVTEATALVLSMATTGTFAALLMATGRR